MKRIIVAVLVSQVFCVTSLVYADATAVVLDKGVKAPFSGLLLSPEAQAKILAEKQKLIEGCEIEKNYLKMREEEKCKHSLNLKKIEQEALQKKLDAIIKIKDSEIDHLRKLAIKNDSSFYKNLWFIGGILTGVAIMIGSSYIVKNVK